jgi:hypothetical protein
MCCCSSWPAVLAAAAGLQYWLLLLPLPSLLLKDVSKAAEARTLQQQLQLCLVCRSNL